MVLVMVQNRKLEHPMPSKTEELNGEYTLFIEHKIHITSTRESHFLWQSKVRQLKNMQQYAVWVEPWVKQHFLPVRTRISHSCCWNERGSGFGKDLRFIHHSTIWLILYSCSAITEAKEKANLIKIKYQVRAKLSNSRIKIHFKSDLLLKHSHVSRKG